MGLEAPKMMKDLEKNMSYFIFGIFLFIPITLLVVYLIAEISAYNKTSYKEITHNSYFETMTDKGKRGECELYRLLRHYEKDGFKLLFNVYLPKANGKTTELDVVLIGSKCIIVFENKNYKGWIFGNDSQKYWTQVLYNGNNRSLKERFYNPVWQNRTHCTVLKEYLPENTAIHSVVLFSNECEFKNLTVKSQDVIVSKHNDANNIVEYLLQYSEQKNIDVSQIYEKLYPYSQVSDEIKQNHIENIRSDKEH